MADYRPKVDWPAGRIVPLPHQSTVLRGNPWGDPTERELNVYLPAAYTSGGAPLPVLWDLAAYTNSGPGHLNWRNQGENLPARLDRLIGQGEMEPVIVAFPDCYTALGGNQYVNSEAVGRYADYLNLELIPLLATELNVIDDRESRGVFGKSSGGFGALHLAMNYPDLWGAVASHAGDVGFEMVFQKEFPTAAQVLAAFKDDFTDYIRAFWRKNRPSGRDYTAMMVLAMAASYDPDIQDPTKIHLPFDVRTCELDPERWQRWLDFDPLLALDKQGEALKSLRALYLDVGIYDQYHIQYGTRRFTDQLNARGIPHRYEEFEGTHSSIDWRLDHSLPYLVGALKKA
ncbi:MAG: alpha/beta hydrolase-fold protein [Xanthomonadales bacterium]|jgi:enterochelin esterase-like enzyme|nr:alpha/beta hydrolase-fold protein [Xanthomonadales bacterium]MDH3925200.1 alpha/beta hydrolase-fold protein [Xanthomonadales bacterium]MDH4002080.1 alpha/beta hydrolase-fold protein [Xanthomonadales bacterium]